MKASKKDNPDDEPRVNERSRSSEILASIRIYSGLILMFYITLHFGNHALGLISVEFMNWVGLSLQAFWRLLPVSIALYGALIAHALAALWVFYKRRSLKMRIRDWAQLLLGLAIPILMLTHIMGTRYAFENYGINDDYAYVLISTFYFSPFNGVMNALGLVAAWVHGCLGVHMWMMDKQHYTYKVQSFGLAFASVYPVLALAGYLSTGRIIADLATSGEWLEEYYNNLNLSSDAVWGLLDNDIEFARIVVIGAIAALIVGRLVRNLISNRRNKVTIEYLDGPTLQQNVGATLLEVSKLANVPHASVCGGRGRCSTCRVKILAAQNVAPASEMEQKVLSRIRAASDVRLACQLVPTSDMKVALLLPSDATMNSSSKQESWSSGQERTVSILFADLRDFTETSENKLPFDVVYLINQFSASMGRSIEANNGRIDKFLGDGLMAIFGIDSTPEQAARDAIAAAIDMRSRLDLLNTKLQDDLEKPMQMGLGIHTGQVVIGDMGYGASRGLTAIGDTVNTASRLEAETKKLQCALCISQITVDYAGMTLPKSSEKRIAIRGKTIELDIYAIKESVLEKLTPFDQKFASNRS